MTKTHARILADIAAKVVAEHRNDASICPLCGKNRPLTFESADPNGTINTCESCVTGEDRRIDRTPDWDYKLDERWQG